MRVVCPKCYVESKELEGINEGGFGYLWYECPCGNITNICSFNEGPGRQGILNHRLKQTGLEKGRANK